MKEEILNLPVEEDILQLLVEKDILYLLDEEEIFQRLSPHSLQYVRTETRHSVSQSGLHVSRRIRVRSSVTSSRFYIVMACLRLARPTAESV